MCKKKELPNLIRLIGDFCQVWRYWLPCETKDENGETTVKKIPFTVAMRNKEGEIEKTVLCEALTGGTVRAKDSNYQNGLFEYELVGDYGKKVRNYTYGDTDIFKFFAHGTASGFGDEKEISVTPPKIEVIVNCIDRDEPSTICKLLCKSDYTLGIPGDIWQAVCDVADAQGDPEEYDIMIKKTGKGTDTKYSVQRPSKRQVPKVIENGITDNEREYEQYDVYEVGRLASAKFQLKYLGDKIQEIDEVMGTNFYQKLVEQSENEKNDNDEVDNDEKQEEIKITEKQEEKKSGRVPLPKKEEIKSDVPTEPCIECGFEFPIDQNKCPKCGMEYEA